MRTLLFLHLLGAAIWVGGHLVLALGILPGALRRRDPQVRESEINQEGKARKLWDIEEGKGI